MIAAQVIRPPHVELLRKPTVGQAHDDRNGSTGSCAVTDEPLGCPLPLCLVIASDNEAGTPDGGATAPRLRMKSEAAVGGDGGCERHRNLEALGGEGQWYGMETVKAGPCVAEDAPDPARVSAAQKGKSLIQLFSRTAPRMSMACREQLCYCFGNCAADCCLKRGKC